MSGLAVALSPATIGEAFADSKSKTTQKENTMTQPGATQRSRELADESPVPNTSENVTGRARRVGAASETALERAAKQRLTGYGLEPATPHVPSGIVIRAVVIGIMAAVYALSAVAQTAKEVKGATPLVPERAAGEADRRSARSRPTGSGARLYSVSDRKPTHSAGIREHRPGGIPTHWTPTLLRGWTVVAYRRHER